MASLKTDVEIRDALINWEACNTFLRTCTEAQAYNLLAVEKKGAKRIQYLLRIFARFNKLRGQRERNILMGAINDTSNND